MSQADPSGDLNLSTDSIVLELHQNDDLFIPVVKHKPKADVREQFMEVVIDDKTRPNGKIQQFCMAIKKHQYSTNHSDTSGPMTYSV